MDLEFSKICKSIEYDTEAKLADVSNLKDLNLSNCVKMKIMLKEIEKNFTIDKCDDLFFTKIVDDLNRIMDELAILSKLHYSFVLLEKHTNAKRKKILARNLKRKAIRNKLKNIIQSKMKSVTDGLQQKALELQDLKDTFEAQKKEYAAYELKFVQNAATLRLKKDLLESQQVELQSDPDPVPNSQEYQPIINTLTLQADQIDEDIADREKENQEIFQSFEHYMKIKFMIDDVGVNCDNLDKLIDEALVEENAASEAMSEIEYRHHILKIDADNKEGAYHAEMNRLNDYYDYLCETVQKARLDGEQARTAMEKLKVSIIESKAMISRIESEFRCWKLSREEESDSELEEEEHEIEQLQKQIAELKENKFH